VTSPVDEGSFTVWRKEDSDAEARVVRAWSAKHAAEKQAREDWLGGLAPWPISYCVRDGASGTIWVVDVALVTQPTFVALDAREVEMPAATHVLWGGRALCEDLRLRTVPGDWPAGQRWISLKDVADVAELQARHALPDRCAACWVKAPTLVEGLRQVGKDAERCL